MIDLQKIDISDFLPHRKPFLMVDKVINLTDDYVETLFTIRQDCILVDANQFLETGLIENAAQTCSAIVGKSYFDDDDTKGEKNKLIGFISAIKKITVFDCPNVGQTITAKAKLISRFDTDAYSICTLQCKTYEHTTELASFEMNLVIQEVN